MTSIRRFWTVLLGTIVALPASFVGSLSAGLAAPPYVALDLSDPRSPDAAPVFVDAMKAARWSSSRPLTFPRDGDAPALANGQTAQTVLFSSGRYPAGDYVLSYRGTGRIGVEGARITDRRPGRLVLDVTPRVGGLVLRLETSEAGNPVRDLHLTFPASSGTPARGPYLPAYVAGLRDAAALRFARWQLGQGLSVHDEVALANQAGINPWFVLPYSVSDPDVVAFARIVRLELDPKLRPIFEWDASPGRATNFALAARSGRIASLVASVFADQPRRAVRLIDPSAAAALLATGSRARAGDYDGLAMAAEDNRAAALAAFARSNRIALFEYRSVPSSPPAPATARVAKMVTWPAYGFDPAHDGYNPNTTAFTPAALPGLHLAWTSGVADYNTQTQPILIANAAGTDGVLLVGGASGTEVGFDALTGSSLWTKPTSQQTLTCGGGGTFDVGTSGTAVYAPIMGAAFVADSQNTAVNGASTVTVHKFNPLTGAEIASVSILPAALPGEVDTAHTSLTLDRKLNLLYVGTGSTCDISSWRGSVTAINSMTMKVVSTFYTAYGRGAKYSGGGVWGWGGVTLDADGDVYFGAGNADNSGANLPPFAKTTSEHVGYAEHLVETTPKLNSVIASNYPGFRGQNAAVDLDFTGSPMLFTPLGCPQLLGMQGKSGQLIFYNTATIADGPVATFQLSEASYEAAYLGNPGWSPNTQLIYASVSSALGGSIEPPGLVAFDVSTCTPVKAWNAAFGPDSFSLDDTPPRTAPTVTAGGVVFLGAPSGASGGALWAIDASSGAILNNGQPILTTPDRIRMAPVVSGNWLWLFDNGGDLYGMTLDADVPAIRNRTIYDRPKQSGYRRFRPSSER
jgi:outer membrane protein assembly factor BamB